MRKSAIIFATSFLIAFSSANAKDYYVANDGDDNNRNSISSPWRTIDKVNSTSFLPGDNIYFKGGDVFVGRIRPSSSGKRRGGAITYTSYGSGQAILRPGSSDEDCISWTIGYDWLKFVNFYLDGCEIGIYINAGNKGDSNRIWFEDNVIFEPPVTGIYMSGVRFVTVRNNHIIDPQEQHGMYLDGFLGARRIIVDGNTIEGAGATCIQLNSNGEERITQSVIKNNLMMNCDIAGINNIGGDATEIHNNIIVGESAGIYNGCSNAYGSCGDHSSINTVVENNTIVTTGPGYAPCFSQASSVPTGNTPPSLDTFINNVCVMNNPGNTALEIYYDLDTPIFDNNLYYAVGGDGLVFDMDGAWIESFADYQSDGYEPNSLNDDPDFVTANGTDYYPGAGSPLVDAGLPVTTGANKDFLGTSTPQGSAMDIGAVERVQ